MVRVAWVVVCWWTLWPGVADSQQRVPGIDFLNDRLPIPDSEQFDEGAYIESGVGLSFGVDKRLTYFTGQYAEAVQRFEQAVRTFRYKAEIWVFLARAYFYEKSPEEARHALQRAGTLMPDLTERLWAPLEASLIWEIRQRALHQQERVDFYSPDQEEFHSLFRLYLFLRDHDAARGVIRAAQGRSRTMRERATMVSGRSRHDQVTQADRWAQLADRLRLEIESLGLEAPAADSSHVATEPQRIPADVDESERVRLLQLRVDFYRAKLEDYLALFQAHFGRQDTARARAVIAALDRRLDEVDLQASVAPTVTDEARLREQWQELQQLRQDLAGQLPSALVPKASP